MAPTIVAVHPEHPEPDIIARAAAIIRDGGLVAFPTETVYGLGANALDANAVARIFSAKGRPAWNPVIAHVADVPAAQALTTSWSDDAQRLADTFWPGPLTLVLPRNSRVPDVVTAGLDAVGVRIPSHPVALALLRAADTPIAAPSANRYTHISPTLAAHVATSLGDRAPLILDGGPSSVGIESTVVDLCGDTPTVLRQGMISRSQLSMCLGRPVGLSVARVRADGDDTTAQRAPGMADRHYAPEADVWLFEPSQRDEIAHALRAFVADPGRRAGDVVGLLQHETLPLGPREIVISMPDDPAAYARALYGALHRADAEHAALIVIELPPDDDRWSAVRDRLSRVSRSRA